MWAQTTGVSHTIFIPLGNKVIFFIINILIIIIIFIIKIIVIISSCLMLIGATLTGYAMPTTKCKYAYGIDDNTFLAENQRNRN